MRTISTSKLPCASVSPSLESWASSSLLRAWWPRSASRIQPKPRRRFPPPVQDEKVGATHSETAVFAGGCFWGVQGVFEHVRGVKQVASGYSGGAARTAQYETVSDGDTGHAESVQITYDPTQITYGRLLQIFFSVAHNPTELDYQGPDHGTQYRSAIFPANAAAAQHRAVVYRAARQRSCVFGRNRDSRGGLQGLLSGGKLSPELPRAASGLPVYRDQRSAESDGPEADVSRICIATIRCC